MTDNIIEVRPLDVKRWHGKSVRELAPSPVVLECYIDRHKRRYLTGLTAEDRERLEKATGLDLNDQFDPENPHPFYSTQNGKVKLEFKTNRFDMNNPIDEIKVKMMKEHPLVANSIVEYQANPSTKALFVIYDSREDIEARAKKAQLKTKVYTMVSKMDATTKRQIVEILTNESMRRQSVDYIDVKLSEAIETKGYEKAIEVINRTKAENFNHSLIVEAVERNIVQKRGETYFYMDEPLGTLYEALKYLADPRNSVIKGQIIDKLE